MIPVVVVSLVLVAVVVGVVLPCVLLIRAYEDPMDED